MIIDGTMLYKYIVVLLLSLVCPFVVVGNSIISTLESS